MERSAKRKKGKQRSSRGEPRRIPKLHRSNKSFTNAMPADAQSGVLPIKKQSSQNRSFPSGLNISISVEAGVCEARGKQKKHLRDEDEHGAKENEENVLHKKLVVQEFEQITERGREKTRISKSRNNSRSRSNSRGSTKQSNAELRSADNSPREKRAYFARNRSRSDPRLIRMGMKTLIDDSQNKTFVGLGDHEVESPSTRSLKRSSCSICFGKSEGFAEFVDSDSFPDIVTSPEEEKKKIILTAKILESKLKCRPSVEELENRNILKQDGKLQALKSKLQNFFKRSGVKSQTITTLSGYTECCYSSAVNDENEETAPQDIERKNFEDQLQKTGKLLKWEDLNFSHQIGEGAYSRVYLAEYREMKVAVKWLKVHRSTERCFYREIACLLMTSENPFTVNFIGATLCPMAIVTEYIQCGSIHQIINSTQEKPPFSILDATQIGWQVAEGIRLMHDEISPPLMHRDLHSKNILYDMDTRRAFICDFGISRLERPQTLPDGSFYYPPSDYSPIGHNRYKAPEVALKLNYSRAADVFMYGTFLYELFLGKDRFEGLADSEVAALCKKDYIPDIPSSIPPEIRKLIRKCWKYNPKKRPTFASIEQTLSNFVQMLEERK